MIKARLVGLIGSMWIAGFNIYTGCLTYNDKKPTMQYEKQFAIFLWMAAGLFILFALKLIPLIIRGWRAMGSGSTFWERVKTVHRVESYPAAHPELLVLVYGIFCLFIAALGGRVKMPLFERIAIGLIGLLAIRRFIQGCINFRKTLRELKRRKTR